MLAALDQDQLAARLRERLHGGAAGLSLSFDEPPEDAILSAYEDAGDIDFQARLRGALAELLNEHVRARLGREPSRPSVGPQPEPFLERVLLLVGMCGAREAFPTLKTYLPAFYDGSSSVGLRLFNAIASLAGPEDMALVPWLQSYANNRDLCRLALTALWHIHRPSALAVLPTVAEALAPTKQPIALARTLASLLGALPPGDVARSVREVEEHLVGASPTAAVFLAEALEGIPFLTPDLRHQIAAWRQQSTSATDNPQTPAAPSKPIAKGGSPDPKELSDRLGPSVASEPRTLDEAYERQLADGDPATEAHFIAHFGRLLRIRVRNRIRQAEPVDDICQEVFLRVFRAIRTPAQGVRHAGRLGAFVASVCDHVTSEYVRGTARHAQVADGAPEAVDQASEGETSLLAEERLVRVRQAIESLPEISRRVVRAVYLQERDLGELCIELGIDRNDLRVLLYRARKQFRLQYVGAEDSSLEASKTDAEHRDVTVLVSKQQPLVEPHLGRLLRELGRLERSA
jgi:RNA polymerase sigma-70 factor (ECF subfamily)